MYELFEQYDLEEKKPKAYGSSNQYIFAWFTFL